ncbi:MAG: nuclear transport factor 2 family protein [Actinobacteria bacterium]|nr:nuclear transport factor 2 family protein [Actinomycetota bacterium]
MEENEALVRAALADWSQSDEISTEAMAGRWVAEPSITAPEGWPESGFFQGREAVIDQLQRLKESWREERVELVAIESAGDRVLVNVRLLGQGESSGVELDMPFWKVCTLVEGKTAASAFTPTRNPPGRSSRATRRFR